MKINHKLMHNNFTKSDFTQVKKLLSKKNVILTQNKQVEIFEKKWSKWLGVRYSTFVNSGSTANYLSVNILKHIKKEKKKLEIIVPALTWISDISSVILNGFKPIFVDINPKTLSMDYEQVRKKISKKTLAIFVTHAQGFSGIDEKLLRLIKSKKIFLLEDVCESHGAKYKNKKLGTYGLISNFSFYYAHHLTTIEGGMICTNNKKIYEISRMIRSHGMVREAKDKKFKIDMIKKHKSLSPQFIFLYPTLNFRNNEIGATIGINQLKKLDSNNKKRTINFKLFLKNLDSNKYWSDFNIKESCNYAFPIVLKTKSIKKRNLFEKKLSSVNIEFRRGNAGGGNQLRQPYLKSYIKSFDKKKFKNVEHIHDFGYYIGNFPSLKKQKIIQICNFLNSLKFL